MTMIQEVAASTLLHHIGIYANDIPVLHDLTKENDNFSAIVALAKNGSGRVEKTLLEMIKMLSDPNFCKQYVVIVLLAKVYDYTQALQAARCAACLPKRGIE